MNYVRRFETWAGAVLEGWLGRIFGGRLQPLDIERRLTDHMHDRVTIGAGRRYVPNSFRAYLAPRTAARFSQYRDSLEAELADGLRRRALEHRLSMVGRVRVRLVADAGVRNEQVRIESDVIEEHGSEARRAGSTTEPIRIEPGGGPAPPPMCLVSGGRRIALPRTRGASLTLGRELGCEVVLDDPSVSRRHARMVARSDHWVLEDLGSRHGTFVNGVRGAPTVLRTGDDIRLGAVCLRLEPESAIQAPNVPDGGEIGGEG